MYEINIQNVKMRNAKVVLKSFTEQKGEYLKSIEASEHVKCRVLKSTLSTSAKSLMQKSEKYETLIETLIAKDPEIDIEKEGMFIEELKKIYLDDDEKPLYNVNLKTDVYDKSGAIVSTKNTHKNSSNICIDAIPLTLGGIVIPKSEAVRKYVFSRHYQLLHVNGLTFDFLYEIAEELQKKDVLMFVGAGEKGRDPLYITTGATPKRGFLEGRVQDGKFLLLLHTTELELKGYEID